MESYILASFSWRGRNVCGFAAQISGRNRREIICHEFWRIGFVYLQTHLLMQAIATSNKQLLSVVV